MRNANRPPATIPPDAPNIGKRPFHGSDDQTVTLIDGIRVLDVPQTAPQIVLDTIAEHRGLLSSTVESMRALPFSPEARGWKQVVANQGHVIADLLSTRTIKD
jgi:hypothetical protein